MSFKREGNDRSLLENLRRRRIRELFAEDIPEDEAKLLCNGRFACLVCNHNPVFDTVNMLMVHRQGKKHAASEAEFVRKKKELKTLILKRKHEQYMKDGTTNIKQAAAASSSSGISSTQPYDPRVKKLKLRPHDRKPRLDLKHPHPASSGGSFNQSTSASSLRVDLTAIPSRHSHQLKNIFRSAQQDPVLAKPYQSQRRKVSTSKPLGSHSSPAVMLAPCDSSSLLSPLSAASEKPLAVKEAGSSQGCNLASVSNPCVTSLDSRVGHPSQWTAATLSQGTVGTCAAAASSELCVWGEGGGGLGRADRSSRVDVQHVSHSADDSKQEADLSASADTAERKERALRYHHVHGSGWKKDWDGKWIKDEEAEFDSDEEPPDLP